MPVLYSATREVFRDAMSAGRAATPPDGGAGIPVFCEGCARLRQNPGGEHAPLVPWPGVLALAVLGVSPLPFSASG